MCPWQQTSFDAMTTVADTLTDKRAPHVPGQTAMWFFVIGDLWIFTCYFACFMYDRGQNPEAFLVGQQALSQNLGAFNTLLLLTSSLWAALCVQAARAQDVIRARRFLLLTTIFGMVFLASKSLEWFLKIDAGLPAGTDEFFVYYFMMTGLHFFHVCLGLIILVLVYWELALRESPNQAFVESGATYWHMVDFLWIIIYALLYLIS